MHAKPPFFSNLGMAMERVWDGATLSCLFFSIPKFVQFKILNGVGRAGGDGKIPKFVSFIFDFCFLFYFFIFVYFYYIKINIFHKKLKYLTFKKLCIKKYNNNNYYYYILKYKIN